MCTRLEPSSQTKVTDLQLAVGIDEQVSRLEISVQHVGRVDVLDMSTAYQDRPTLRPQSV
jgi:hypothetical protein